MSIIGRNYSKKWNTFITNNALGCKPLYLYVAPLAMTKNMQRTWDQFGVEQQALEECEPSLKAKLTKTWIRLLWKHLGIEQNTNCICKTNLTNAVQYGESERLPKIYFQARENRTEKERSFGDGLKGSFVRREKRSPPGAESVGGGAVSIG